ncbi:MAG: FAD-binding oxidoreductase [Proteobacteria bacterium]|nr:FAD-binding oxidoreductase [Pseudomonadota bacterium]
MTGPGGTPPDAVLTALRDELGDAAVRLHEPISVDAQALAATVAPESADALATALRLLDEHAQPAVVRGGGEHQDYGNRLSGGSLWLSTEALCGVDALEPEDGVVRAGAGTPLADVRRQAGELGWELPLDPPGERTTVGGALATALFGPRHLGFGPPRDAVLGLDVVLAGGQHTRCGGRVVKNVSGYDLCKLYTGSLGTLGVIERAWLRLRPRPAQVQVVTARVANAAEGLELGRAAARRPSARAVGLAWHEDERGWELVAEFAGDDPGPREDAEWLGDRVALESGDATDLARVGGRRDPPAPGGLRVRCHAPVSQLEGLVAGLETAAALVVLPGSGVVWASFATAAQGLAVVDALALSPGGAYVMEALPVEAKRERDVFALDSATRGIMQRIRRQYDPRELLNPGRMLKAAP